MKEKKPAIIKQNEKTRIALSKQFIESVILDQYRQLVAWQTVTSQSSQIDSGYLGQHLVSLLTGIPGRGMGGRGKGEDLEDGSEVKAASTLSGVDKPRWNNNIGSSATRTKYLKCPNIFFVLYDTVAKNKPFPLRVRIWRVCPKNDKYFKKVVREWAKGKTSGNFQLHPPCWNDSNVATNQNGNLELPLMFHAQQKDIGDIDYMEVLYVSFKKSISKTIT